jgi:hypothetical protein
MTASKRGAATSPGTEGDINARQRPHAQPDNRVEDDRVTPSEKTAFVDECDCGWPANNCAEDTELVEDCPRWKQAQEASDDADAE